MSHNQIMLKKFCAAIWTCFCCFGFLFSSSSADLLNVAQSKHGGRCVGASSEYSNNHRCSIAIDGELNENLISWATQGEGVGSWIDIGFNASYLLIKAKMVQRKKGVEQNKKIELSFSDGSKQQFQLKNYTEMDKWSTFNLKPVITNNVNLSVLSVYSKINNGFKEIEYYAVSFSAPQASTMNGDEFVCQVHDLWETNAKFKIVNSGDPISCAQKCLIRPKCSGFKVIRDICYIFLGEEARQACQLDDIYAQCQTCSEF